jgi:parallel beta-helix repeat protein
MKTHNRIFKRILKTGVLNVMVWICIIMITGHLYPAFGFTTSGTLAGNETWSGVVDISGDVIVPEGIVLTISPEATVKFDAGLGLELLINGTLIAEGTAGSNITFTSNAGSPDQWDWTWIRFSDTGGGSIRYCQIKYANTGVRINNSSPTIRDNVFSYNNYGINSTNSSSVIENNIFDDNDYGICVNASSSSIKNNLFLNNFYDGINIHNSSSALGIYNNIIYESITHGIEIEYTSTPLVVNNTLYNNSKSGIYIKNNSAPDVKNNIITNSFNFGILTYNSSSPAIQYNDLFGNIDGNYYDYDASGYFSPSPGTGEISADPLFVDVTDPNPANWDFHLQGSSPAIDAGDPVETLTSDYTGGMSLAVDAVTGVSVGHTIWITDGANTESDVAAGTTGTTITLVSGFINSYQVADGAYVYTKSSKFSNEPQPNGNQINIGAYGGTTEATTKTTINGDIDGDQDIDGLDLALLLNAFNSVTGDPSYNPDADLTNDGNVDGADLSMFAGQFGKTN